MNPHLDDHAEITVIGAALFSPRAAELVRQRLTADDFHDAALGAVFAVLDQLPTVAPDHALAPLAPMLWELRAEAAHRLAHVRHDQLREVVSLRLSLEDEDGRYARRVKSAARRRRLRAGIVEALELVDAEDLERVAELLYELGTLASVEATP